MITISFKIKDNSYIDKIIGMLKVFDVQDIEQKEDSDAVSHFVLTDKHLDILEKREKRAEYQDAEEALNELDLKYEL